MAYRFCIADVFTERRFGGNQLAVLPDARGLGTEQMQRVTREFGYSESTFVLPPEDPAHTRRVRIFTCAREIPFAGHPNVGTAFVLASLGEIQPDGDEARVVFEEGAGPVPVTVRFREGRPVSAELEAPAPLSLGEPLDPARVAAALGLAASDIVTDVHAARLASVGISFVCVELASRDALARAATDAARMREHLPEAATEGVHLYTRDTGLEDADLRARMFAPGHGVVEDAATGSANCALAGLLASSDPRADGELAWRIAQGVEMGRPSRLHARVRKARGAVEAVFIGGASVMVARGEIEAGVD